MKRFLPYLLAGCLGLAAALATSAYTQHRLLSDLPSRLNPLVDSLRAAMAQQDVLGLGPTSDDAVAGDLLEKSLRALESMEPGTGASPLRFDNPDVVQLVQQFRQRLRHLEEREARLKALDERIRLELQHLSVMTQWVHQAESTQQSLLSNRMAYVRMEEQRALADHARRLQSLPAAQAVTLITQFPPVEIARTLWIMGPSNAAPILGGIIASGPDGARLAADVSRQMQRLSLLPPPGATNTALQPPRGREP